MDSYLEPVTTADSAPDTGQPAPGAQAGFLKVGSRTDPRRLARAIDAALRARGTCDLVAVGPNAIVAAVNGIAAAGGLASARAHDLSCRIYFLQVRVDSGAERSGRLFRVSAAPIR